MTDIRKPVSNRALGNEQGITGSSKTEKENFQIPVTIPDLPIPLKGGHTAALHDTGVQFTVLPGGLDSESGMLPILGLDDFISQHRESLIHLLQPLLVRLNLAHKSGDTVRILCASEDVGCKGIRLMLPCQLGLCAGKTLDMELFLPQATDPIKVNGTVRRVQRSNAEDMVRYAVEVEFGQLSGLTERELAAFIYASQLHERRRLLA